MDQTEAAMLILTLRIFPGTNKLWQASGFTAIRFTRPYSSMPFRSCCSIGISLVVECKTIALKNKNKKTKRKTSWGGGGLMISLIFSPLPDHAFLTIHLYLVCVSTADNFISPHHQRLYVCCIFNLEMYNVKEEIQKVKSV